MNYLLFGCFSLICSTVSWVYFGTYPASAAVFPKLITAACFILPGIVSIVIGIRQRNYEKYSGEAISAWMKGFIETIKSSSFHKIVLLVILTLLYVWGTSLIGYFQTSVIYFLVVLFLVYRTPVKETLIYTIGSVGFLYVFFKLIFNVRI